jgi:hypothetical protein
MVDRSRQRASTFGEKQALTDLERARGIEPLTFSLGSGKVTRAIKRLAVKTHTVCRKGALAHQERL